MEKEIRWKQRFQNFEKTFLFLKKGVELGKYDDQAQKALHLIRKIYFPSLEQVYLTLLKLK